MLAPPSISLAASCRLERASSTGTRAKRFTVTDCFEHLGFPFAAATGEVLAGVVHEHVELLDARRRARANLVGFAACGRRGTRTVRDRRRSRPPLSAAGNRHVVPASAERVRHGVADARVPPVTSTSGPSKSKVTLTTPPPIACPAERYIASEPQLADRVHGVGRRGRALQHRAGEVGELGLVRDR